MCTGVLWYWGTVCTAVLGYWGTHRHSALARHAWHTALPDESSWPRGSWVALGARGTCIPRGAGEAQLTLNALL